MKVTIRLESASTPIEYNHVRSTYVKKGFYCLQVLYKKVVKYPVHNIFDIVEEEED